MAAPPIRALLQRAAADGIGAAGDVPLAAPEDAAREVVARIATTVLGRHLVLSFDGTPRLTLSVAMRRVVRAAGPSEAGPVIYDETTPEGAEVLAEVLTDWGSRSRVLSIVAVGASVDVPPGSRGLSARDLATAAGLPPGPEAGTDLHAAFVDAARGTCPAVLLVSEDAHHPVAGTAADLAFLADLAHAQCPDNDAGPAGLPRLLLLGAQDAPDRTICIADFPQGRVFAISNAAALPRLLGVIAAPG